MAKFEEFAGAIAANAPLLISSAAILLLTWQVTAMAYNLLFHPLRHVPGPLLQRASALPWAIQHALGKSAFETQKLHDRYGPVVRIAPSHLSFTDARAWRDIYSALPRSSSSSSSDNNNNNTTTMTQQSGWPEMPKSRTFTLPTNDQTTSVVSADFHEHQTVRRALSHGFSDASLRRQEPVLQRYVDYLLRRMHERCDDDGGGDGGDGGGGALLDMSRWYNYATFDIVGELVFGQAFGCLDRCEYHPWIAFVLASMKAAATCISVSYLGGHWLVSLVAQTVGEKSIAKLRKMTGEIVSRRLAAGKGQNDMFEVFVKNRDEWGFSFEKLSANATILTLAGSETSATSLCGTTYLLLKHPKTMEKLNREIRQAFSSAEEITMAAVSQLPYLTAVINESLRMYPPVVSNLIRVIPPEGKQIVGQYVAGGTLVEVQPWSINHSRDNWVDPWTFNPDRFLPGEHEARAAGNILEASQPFSFGQRNCIGRNLSIAEMRMILARVVFDFDMKLGDDSDNWIGRQRTYPLWARVPLNVHFTPVKRG